MDGVVSAELSSNALRRTVVGPISCHPLKSVSFAVEQLGDTVNYYAVNLISMSAARRALRTSPSAARPPQYWGGTTAARRGTGAAAKTESLESWASLQPVPITLDARTAKVCVNGQYYFVFRQAIDWPEAPVARTN